MDQLNFYERLGGAFVYLNHRDSIIYQYDGIPVASVRDEAVFDPKGKHIGWFCKGWVTDIAGDAVLYSRSSSLESLPVPGMRPAPIKRERPPAPALPAGQLTGKKPERIVRWSSQSIGDFFGRQMEREALPKWQ